MAIANDVKLGTGVIIHNSELVNLYGCKIGSDTRIGAFVEIQKEVLIGSRCKISSHTFICTGVRIENNVFVGHGVMFTNDVYPRATNPNGNIRQESDWKKNFKKTIVKKGASIGSGSVILPGVIVGSNSIVGAGSVVTKSVPANWIVAGNPAKFIRKIKDE
jgi:UDP-2-acetamido-3-amino-2,3-dideoxy-glucuronate N-acetyltransferase